MNDKTGRLATKSTIIYNIKHQVKDNEGQQIKIMIMMKIKMKQVNRESFDKTATQNLSTYDKEK